MSMGEAFYIASVAVLWFAIIRLHGKRAELQREIDRLKLQPPAKSREALAITITCDNAQALSALAEVRLAAENASAAVDALTQKRIGAGSSISNRSTP